MAVGKKRPLEVDFGHCAELTQEVFCCGLCTGLQGKQVSAEIAHRIGKRLEAFVKPLLAELDRCLDERLLEYDGLLWLVVSRPSPARSPSCLLTKRADRLCR